MRKRSEGTGSRGFTLLEVLVAIMVFSVFAVALIQIFAGGLKLISVSDDQVAAVSRAQGLLEEALLDQDLGEGTRSTVTDDGYEVEITVQPALEERLSSVPLKLEEVDLVLRWKRGLGERVFRLSALRWRKT